MMIQLFDLVSAIHHQSFAMKCIIIEIFDKICNFRLQTYLANPARLPGQIVPQVGTPEDQVSHTYDSQVNAHQKVSQRQVSHEHWECSLGGLPVKG